MQNNDNELFTWVIKAGASRIYYLNVKKDKNGELYLVIKESKTLVEGQKDVHRVMVFQRDFRTFVDGMRRVIEFINNHPTSQIPEDLTIKNSSNKDHQENFNSDKTSNFPKSSNAFDSSSNEEDESQIVINLTGDNNDSWETEFKDLIG